MKGSRLIRLQGPYVDLDEIERTAAPYSRLALEVNAVPPNAGSLAFHAARGFVEVGVLGDDTKAVSLMTKELG